MIVSEPILKPLPGLIMMLFNVAVPLVSATEPKIEPPASKVIVPLIVPAVVDDTTALSIAEDSMVVFAGIAERVVFVAGSGANFRVVLPTLAENVASPS